MAHGPDAEHAEHDDQDGEASATWGAKVEALWDKGSRAAWEIAHGYPSIRNRRARLEAILDARRVC
jgi:hypothetical protein